MSCVGAEMNTCSALVPVRFQIRGVAVRVESAGGGGEGAGGEEVGQKKTGVHGRKERRGIVQWQRI